MYDGSSFLIPSVDMKEVHVCLFRQQDFPGSLVFLNIGIKVGSVRKKVALEMRLEDRSRSSWASAKVDHTMSRN